MDSIRSWVSVDVSWRHIWFASVNIQLFMFGKFT